ncbi:MAG: hypothetical protein ABEJ65_11000 [bacterium]
MYCYYEGFDEDGDVEGTMVPVEINESNVDQIKELETLYVMDPLEVKPETVGENDYITIKNYVEETNNE